MDFPAYVKLSYRVNLAAQRAINFVSYLHIRVTYASKMQTQQAHFYQAIIILPTNIEIIVQTKNCGLMFENCSPSQRNYRSTGSVDVTLIKQKFGLCQYVNFNEIL